MATRVPVVKQVAWVSLIPHLGVLTILCLISYWCGVSDMRRALLSGLGLYWLIVFAIKMLGATNHRKGMRLVRKEKFLEAIPHFEASYLHFTKKAWIDKYRYLTMLSSSAMCYREMALCNIAFCYSQSGNGTKAIQYYNQVLQEYPENGLAKTAMRLRESMREAANNQ
jgi:tetratricopeptide (TPR) repeat protein